MKFFYKIINNMVKSVNSVFLFFMLLCTLVIVPSVSLGAFMMSKKPVNPACLKMINGSLADLPFIYELNMDRCQSSNAAYLGDNGTTTFVSGKNTATQSQYSYKVIGQATNGIYVILTTSSGGGGSGVFNDVMLTRLVKKQRNVYDSKTNRFKNKMYVALVYVADLGGGDRASGSYYDLKVVGNKLIGKRHASNALPVGKSPAKNKIIEIDLAGIS